MEIDGYPYIPRLVDPLVERMLRAFGAVEITGPMWCGKTWTARAHGSGGVNLDDEGARMLAEADPVAVLAGPRPHVVDEWQLVPPIWDAVRREVDSHPGERGLFILTGSSRPSKDKTAHSGAGRIARLAMEPFTLQESGHSTGAVSLLGLFEGRFQPAVSHTSLLDLPALICRGGWPAAQDLELDEALMVPGRYIDAVIAGEDPAAPAPPAELTRFLESCARNVGSAVTLKTLARDMAPHLPAGDLQTQERHVRELLDYFLGRYILCDLNGWDAPIKSPQRLRTKPKHCFADPSIPAAVLGVMPQALPGNMQLFGQLFEELCLRDLRVYTSCIPGAKPDSLRYYRDSDGLEVDCIIELRDGRWGAVEVKLSDVKVPEAEKSLLRLANKIAANPSARNPEPSFLMALVGKSQMSARLPSGVYVVPITQLGA